MTDLGPWVHDWARYRAVDPSGHLYEYSEKPVCINAGWGWYTNSGMSDAVGLMHSSINWKTSLEERKMTDLGPWVHDWARYRAVDGTSGHLYEYEEKPKCLRGVKYWYACTGRVSMISIMDAVTGWETSLEERKDCVRVGLSGGQTIEARNAATDRQVGGDHYKVMGDYQPWNVLQSWLTPEEFRGYMKGTAIAYLAREGRKGRDEDIAKASHTLEALVAKLSEVQE